MLEIVWVVTIFQNYPIKTEYIHSVHETRESAEMVSNDLEEQMGENFTVEVEPFRVNNVEYGDLEESLDDEQE